MNVKYRGLQTTGCSGQSCNSLVTFFSLNKHLKFRNEKLHFIRGTLHESRLKQPILEIT